RISLAKSKLPYDLGGLGVPDFKLYFWASQLRAVLQWTSSGETQDWVFMELSELPCNLWDLILFPVTSVKLLPDIVNNFTSLSLAIWYKVHEFTKSLVKVSPYTPIWRNVRLAPCLLDLGFGQWHSQGIRNVGYLLDKGNFMSWIQILQKFALPRTLFFRYLQIRHILLSTGKQGLISMFPSPLELRVVGIGQMEKFVTQTSQLIILDLNECKTFKLRLLSEITLDTWKDICFLLKNVTLASKYKLNHFKTIHRLCYTPTRLHHMDPASSPMCWRCKDSNGTLFHIFWECLRIWHFWSEVSVFVQKVVGWPLPESPVLFLLLDVSDLDTLPKGRLKFLQTALLVAKNVLTHHWHDESSPTWLEWLNELIACMNLEKIHYMVNLNSQTFVQTWQAFQDVLVSET
uniref:Reverse transcriptase zinc-binding domain-containing protein n=1 Tax=Latimeria chalumnae TaxID=7897 RepID=H3BDB3_LATCH